LDNTVIMPERIDGPKPGIHVSLEIAGVMEKYLLDVPYVHVGAELVSWITKLRARSLGLTEEDIKASMEEGKKLSIKEALSRYKR
jgi:hypothetical protein